MAYKFRPDESVRSGILRCSREQLDRALIELSEGVATDPVEAIHTARKAIKKQRSLLRLARGAMTSEQRRRENAALREAARGLGGARDADVMIASIGQLFERFAGQLPAAAFQTIQAHLEARRGHRGGSVVDDRVLQELAAVRGRVDLWQLHTAGWEALENGLLRSYRRGRRAFARARVVGEMEDLDVVGEMEHLHEWRKRVKDLWYHERLLAPTCGATVRGHAEELDRLSDLLGDDHDLALLRQELTDDGTPVAVGSDAVVNLIDHRRAELQTEAMRIGERLYVETPKAFRIRMRASWTAGCELARASHERHPERLAAAIR
jgi:CHAD domain-containing protein